MNGHDNKFPKEEKKQGDSPCTALEPSKKNELLSLSEELSCDPNPLSQSLSDGSQEHASSSSDDSQENPSSLSDSSQEYVSSSSDDSQENSSLLSDGSQEYVSSPSDDFQENSSFLSDSSQEHISSPSDDSQENSSLLSDSSQGHVFSPSDDSQENSSSLSDDSQNTFFPRKNHAPKHRTPEQRRRLFRRILVSVAASILAVFLLAGVSICCLIAAAPDIDSVTVSPTESATYIYDQNGNQLRKLTLSSANRDIVSLEEIPTTLQNAIVSIEDQRFYEHGGIDLRGIVRAFWSGIRSGSFSEGASTITQQLIKNSIFTEWTKEDSFWDRLSRKIQEQYLALQLEERMSKQEILEDYLNTINFGSGNYGVQSASRRYFGKPVSELTLSEASVLAAIPQNPAALNPISNPENNSRRRAVVLRYMQEQGYITPEERTEALNDNVYDRIREYDATYEEDAAYSYYEDALIDQVMESLTDEAGYTHDQAYRAVYSGGLQIISAQDPQIQAICDEEFANAANFPAGTEYGVDYALSVSDENEIVTHYSSEDLKRFIRETSDPSFDLMCQDPETAQRYAASFKESILASDGSSDDSAPDSDSADGSSSLNVLAERLTLSPQPQASVAIIDQKTGYVRAIVGGRGEKTASLTLNRATETTRQPGSTFKILTAYAPALDVCGQTLATLYDNEPYNYQDGTPVSNWDLNDYSGPTSIREAITRSVNVVAVKCITEITPQLGFQYARKFGISTLHEYYESMGNHSSDIVQPLALGGITQGVTNLELCNAYASIANGGIYHKPKFFTRILDRHGNVLIDHSETDDETRVLKASTAFLLTSAMEDVVSSEEGTAFGSISAGLMPVSGKTGTTSSYKDIWFVGYTPYYTCCVWGGYDNNESLPDGSTYHTYNKILWTSIMTRIHSALPPARFNQPKDVVAVTLCRETNLPAVRDGCKTTYTEFYVKGTQPVGACPIHRPLPQTESPLIYQDVLDKLLPETEPQTSPETDNQTPSAADSQLPSATDSQTPSAAGSQLPSATDSQTPSAADSQLPSATDSQTPSAAGSQLPSATDSQTPSAAGSQLPSATDSQTPSAAGSQLPSATDSQTPSAADNQAPYTSADQSSNGGQPQTTSLDDMIDQLSRYGLP